MSARAVWKPLGALKRRVADSSEPPLCRDLLTDAAVRRSIGTWSYLVSP
jgi:hypothetical protein